MGSSAKKKREKKQDFQKTKLKVGKARPKNTNATDTSFSAKSIIFKQQNLSEGARDASALFNNNLSLLSSRNETQRRDALIYLITATTAVHDLPQPVSVLVTKAQPLVLDGNASVRQQLLKLLKTLPQDKIGSLDQLLLYTRAGMTHLSSDIRSSSLEVFDWMIESHSDTVLNCAGGWTKTLLTFQNLLSWHGTSKTNRETEVSAKWSAGKTTTNLGSNKLQVNQIISLSRFLTAGLARAPLNETIQAKKTAALFPLWNTGAHLLPQKSNAFGHLNLFGVPRDLESEIYDDVEERSNIFVEMGLHKAFADGAKEAKREGGEIGRASALVDKALRLVLPT